MTRLRYCPNTEEASICSLFLKTNNTLRQTQLHKRWISSQRNNQFNRMMIK